MRHIVQNQNTAMKRLHSQTGANAPPLAVMYLLIHAKKFLLKLEQPTVKAILTNSLGSSVIKGLLRENVAGFI